MPQSSWCSRWSWWECWISAVSGHPSAEAGDGALGNEGEVPSCISGFDSALARTGGSWSHVLDFVIVFEHNLPGSQSVQGMVSVFSDVVRHPQSQ